MKYIILAFACFYASIISAQAPTYKSQNISLLGTWDDTSIPSSGPSINNRYNSCWGYAAKGKEYAIVGASNGVHIIDITNPSNPIRRDFVAGRRDKTIWREYKVYQNYLYCISDDSSPNSFQILDLSYLPDSVKVVYDGTDLFERGHTIWIEKSNMYIAGGEGTLALYSLSNPKKPTRIRSVSEDFPSIAKAHDMFVRNDTIYGSFGFSGMYILYYDKKLSKFVELNKITQYPASGYNHSSLLMPDGKTLIMLDEVPKSLPLKIMDVANLQDIQLDCTFSSGSKATPHNPFLAPNNKVVLSYYEDGIQVYDVSNSKSPVKTGFFDTHYQSDENNTVGNYVGVWSAYTELPSQNLVAVDMQNGLFVLDAKKAYSFTTNTADRTENEKISIYPNPFEDELIFNSPDNDKVNISVFDIRGAAIVALDNVLIDSFRLNMSSLSQGVYFIQIKNQYFTKTTKVVKQ